MNFTANPEIDLNYAQIVGRYAHIFDKPEVRLRFFNNTLAKHAAIQEKLDGYALRHKFIRRSKLYPLFRDWWLYVLIIREVRHFSRKQPRKARPAWRKFKVPFGSLVLFHIYQLRFVYGTLAVVVAAIMTAGVFSLAVKSFTRADTAFAQQNKQVFSHQNGYDEVAKHLPDYKPVKVWLVEEKDNVERYSNGLRILREYETTNHRRGYSIYNMDGSAADANLQREPLGIVYHTSESDILPFFSENNDSIESRSRALLNFVQSNKSYNYLIDRFGQVYRIVRDDQSANHSGNSIWADKRGVYVGLNESFLGVCFETRSESDQSEEQLTEAQVLAGRLLTQILRSRYDIDDAACVTHGLVSVNPSNMLISYHHDWVRGFPFEAMGLSDKYKVSTPSISVYGFSYDDQVVKVAGGKIWAGAEIAESEFEARAEQAQMTVEELRRKMRDLYQAQMADQKAARLQSPDESRATEMNNFDKEAARPLKRRAVG